MSLLIASSGGLGVPDRRSRAMRLFSRLSLSDRPRQLPDGSRLRPRSVGLDSRSFLRVFLSKSSLRVAEVWIRPVGEGERELSEGVSLYRLFRRDVARSRSYLSSS